MNAPNPSAASRVLERCRESGVLIGKGGLHANCLRLAPPLCISLEQADRAADVLLDALTEADAAERAR